ncbi:ABC-three component system protein [Actinomadura luteofluorescens]|uniref:ABC-three component system protein n=1 Tax=Actinomadura luteofluorescens TaxID=46163 RepID=UPI003637D18A
MRDRSRGPCRRVVDYFRAYTHTVQWLDEQLIGMPELERFEAELIDEWEREFEWMLLELDEDTDEAAGLEHLRNGVLQHPGLVAVGPCGLRSGRRSGAVLRPARRG